MYSVLCKVKDYLTVVVVLWVWGLSSASMDFATVSRAAEPPAEIQIAGKDCLDADCHAAMISGKVVHGPVAQGKCASCHEQLRPDIHVFDPIQTQNELCASCHVLSMKNFVHQPVREGKCSECHDPHQSDFRFMLRSDPAQDLCLDCHSDEPFMGSKHVHSPVALGVCILCHEPHSAWNPNLLIKSGRKLCLACHEQIDQRLAEAHYAHAAVKDDCTICHDPHGSDHKALLSDRQKNICLSCHESIAQLIQNSDYVHGAVDTQDDCGNCHNGHTSILPVLLKRPLMDSCLTCHNKPITMPDGKILTDMATLLKHNPDHHGPVQRADCSACHNPHASGNFKRLNEEYPEPFYAPFDLGNYALCFQCHVSEMVTTEYGRGLTRFKQGERNLHFVHVNKKRRGRTCRACHEVHASRNPFHIRTSVPFGPGGWEYAINFKQTDGGGTCAPGCHKPREYVRMGGDVSLPKPLEKIPIPKEEVEKK